MLCPLTHNAEGKIPQGQYCGRHDTCYVRYPPGEVMVHAFARRYHSLASLTYQAYASPCSISRPCGTYVEVESLEHWHRTQPTPSEEDPWSIAPIACRWRKAWVRTCTRCVVLSGRVCFHVLCDCVNFISRRLSRSLIIESSLKLNAGPKCPAWGQSSDRNDTKTEGVLCFANVVTEEQITARFALCPAQFLYHIVVQDPLMERVDGQ